MKFGLNRNEVCAINAAKRCCVLRTQTHTKETCFRKSLLCGGSGWIHAPREVRSLREPSHCMSLVSLPTANRHEMDNVVRIHNNFLIKNKKDSLLAIFFVLVGAGGFEPPKAVPTDLQSAPFGHSGTLPHIRYSLMNKKWSWWTDSNPRPADYKSAALPTELHQRLNA